MTMPAAKVPLRRAGWVTQAAENDPALLGAASLALLVTGTEGQAS